MFWDTLATLPLASNNGERGEVSYPSYKDKFVKSGVGIFNSDN